MTFVIDIASATDRGRVRPHNEDAIASAPGLGYAVLADGLGGCQAGEIASRLAVDAVSAMLEAGLRPRASESLAEREATDLVARAMSAANSAVFDAARADPERAGMGTTLVVALWRGERLVAGHVGDSRLYCMRSDQLVQLTRDHSLAQETLDGGFVPRDPAQLAAARSIVTRAVGLDREVQSEISTFDSAPADVYLLCSDGLTDMLSVAEIHGVLGSALPELQRAADALVVAANDKGGRDNISVILARVREGQDAA